MDDLAAMRVYVRVVERGSMSAAARDLGMGQSSVSERIERLEARLGLRLLHRNTRTLTPSDLGARFYERCKLAIEAADHALATAREDTALRGLLRIAAPHAFGEGVLAAILAGLQDRHPDLRLDLVLNDHLVDPVTEGVDISIRLGTPGDGAFVARRLGHVGRLLVAAPDYLERHGTPHRPTDLAAHRFARVAGLFNNGELPLVAQNGRRISTSVDIVTTVSHWHALQAVIRAGAAIGVLQASVCEEDLASGRVVRLLPALTVPGFDVHALYPAARPIASRARAVLDLLAAELPPAIREA